MMNWLSDVLRLPPSQNPNRGFRRGPLRQSLADFTKTLRTLGVSLIAAAAVAGCGGGGGGGDIYSVTVDGSSVPLTSRFEGGDIVL